MAPAVFLVVVVAGFGLLGEGLQLLLLLGDGLLQFCDSCSFLVGAFGAPVGALRCLALDAVLAETEVELVALLAVPPSRLATPLSLAGCLGVAWWCAGVAESALSSLTIRVNRGSTRMSCK